MLKRPGTDVGLIAVFRLFRRALPAVIMAAQCLLAAIYPLAAAAGDDDESMFSAADARLHRADPAKGDPYSNRWQGELPVHGILSVTFDRSIHEPPKKASDLTTVTFTPDKESSALLPHATGSYTAPIEDLYVAGDPGDLLKNLIGKRQAANVLHGSAIKYQWPVSLTITEFRASIECDHRIYGMDQTALRIDNEHLDAAFRAID